MHRGHRITYHQVNDDRSGESSGRSVVLTEYEQFCKAAGMSPRTIRLRLQWLTRLGRDVDLVRATRNSLLAWLARHDWQPETRKSARNAFRSFYRWATEEGYVEDDPTLRLPAIKVPAAAPRPTPTHVVREALSGASERNQLIIGLAAFAGLRVSEIAALPWSAVEWSGLRVKGKGGRTRVVPLLPRLALMLNAEKGRREGGQVCNGWRYAVDPASPYILPSHLGGHMSAYTVGKVLSRALGPGWSAHSLRHRFATLAYAVDRDLLTVQQLMGHSRPETTARYTETPQGAARAAVAGVAA